MTARFSLDKTLHFHAAVDIPSAPRTSMQRETPVVQPVTPPAADTPRRVLESIFIPEGYEPNYAYPLIVWIVGPHDNKREELKRVMPGISTRNYLGLSFCPETAAEGDGADSGLFEIEQQLCDRIARLQRRYNVHTERVFLAGFGAGATWALRLGLSRPEWFAGVAAMAGKFPAGACSLNRFRELHGKRVMLGTSRSDAEVSVAEIQRTSRLLHAAGLRVCTRLYEGGHELHPAMLTEIDRWVMQEIFQAQRA